MGTRTKSMKSYADALPPGKAIVLWIDKGSNGKPHYVAMFAGEAAYSTISPASALSRAFAIFKVLEKKRLETGTE